MFFFFLDPKEMPVFGRGLEKLEQSLDCLREVDPGMPIGGAAALIHLARRLPTLASGSINLRDVASEMQLAYPTFLRHTDILSEGATGTRQLKLIEKGVHPKDKRARQVRLTNDGLILLEKLDRINT